MQSLYFPQRRVRYQKPTHKKLFEIYEKETKKDKSEDIGAMFCEKSAVKHTDKK